MESTPLKALHSTEILLRFELGLTFCKGLGMVFCISDSLFHRYLGTRDVSD